MSCVDLPCILRFTCCGSTAKGRSRGPSQASGLSCALPGFHLCYRVYSSAVPVRTDEHRLSGFYPSCVFILRKRVLFFSYHFLVSVPSWFLIAYNRCPSVEISFCCFFPRTLVFFSYLAKSKVKYKFLGKSFTHNKHFFFIKFRGFRDCLNPFNGL